MLLHVPNVLSAEELAHIRSQLDAAPWVDGRQTVGSLGAQVKRNEQLEDGAAIRLELGRGVQAAVARHPVYFSAVLPRASLAPRFNRYRDGGEYGFHVDGSVLRNGEGQLRSDVSCTVFLCEPDEYDGGELIVADTYGEHEVKLPAGDAIVYPSSSLHRVTPVTRGARLAAFFWVQSLVRDESKRRLLFEMDAAIQTLRAENANPQALLQLANSYHNLLRRWAEV